MGCNQNRAYSGGSYSLKNLNNDSNINNNNAIEPGPCDPEYGCPEPTEIVCLQVEKVFDSCQKAKMNVDVTDVSTIAVGQIDPDSIVCKFAEIFEDPDHPFICTKINGTNRARVSFYYIFKFRFEDEEGVKTFTSEPILYDLTVIMDDIIQDPRTFVQCQVFLDCVECFLSNDQEITCCIGKWVIFKVISLVQLMVPAYGYCPEPPVCPEPLAPECPDFEPVWPPYPPQPEWPVNNNNNG